MGQCTSLDTESGIRLALGRNSRGFAEYEHVRSRVTRSGHNTPHHVGTLGPVGSGANATVAACLIASVAIRADSNVVDAAPKRVDTRGSSHSQHFKSIETKEGGMMVITTTKNTQMHDIVKTLHDGPESAKAILWSVFLGWEKSLRKHGKTTMKYRVTCPLQHVVTISVEAQTSVC